MDAGQCGCAVAGRDVGEELRWRILAPSPDGEKGRRGDGEMGRRGDGETGRWGDGETGSGRRVEVAISRSVRS